MEKKKTTRKRTARRKKEDRRKKWRKRLIDWVEVLAFAAMYIAVYELGSCTIVYMPSGIWWGFVLTTPLAMTVWAALKKRLDTGTFVWYSFVGVLGGMALYLFMVMLFLGTNFLFPRSNLYQREAVVYKKSEKRAFRGPSWHYIVLHFDDGRYYYWNGGYKKFDRFQKGDTCAVTLYKGLWGFEVVRDVVITGAAKRPERLHSGFSAILRRVEAKPGTLDERILHAIGRNAYNGRHGLPISVRQVTDKDMGGEFRVGLLNHTTLEEIESGQRIFVECTWDLGKKDEHGELCRTCWYEWRRETLHPVDSLLWSTDEEF